MRFPLSSPSSRQRGIGTLAISLLLLFGASIVLFYLNRGLIFEQKTSANQSRSTSAFEIAEAGVEWAIGMLNGTVDITTACVPDTAAVNTSFRQRYLQTGYPSNMNLAVATTTFPGCKLNGTTLTCNCPTHVAGSETVAALGTAVLPSFTVAFSTVTDSLGTVDSAAVRITSTGCTAQAGACKPATSTAATTGASDATATVSAIVKNVPDLRAAPQSALTCGTSCGVGGSYNIRNVEVASNGYLVNAGTAITSGMGTGYETIPGQPVQNALVANDASLSALSSSDPTCSSSAMFREYFGTTMQEYAESESVATIPGCNNAATCGNLIVAAYNNNYRNFYFPDGMDLNNSSGLPSPFGVDGEGVRLVSPGDININGNITINGLIFSNSANFNDLGTGTADINGAMITCAAYNNNGNGLLNYSSGNLGSSGLGVGQMIRVPGSWRDF